MRILEYIYGYGKEIARIDKNIMILVKIDTIINEIYKQFTSISGVGNITAQALLCYNNGFNKFEKPRQLALYCGVVPFQYTSGKSIKGKPSVHFIANKNLK